MDISVASRLNYKIQPVLDSPRAYLLRRMNQDEAAADAHQRVFDLCGNNADRAGLQRRLNEMFSLIL